MQEGPCACARIPLNQGEVKETAPSPDTLCPLQGPEGGPAFRHVFLPRDSSTSPLVHVPCLYLTPLHIPPAPCQLASAKRSAPWQRSEAFLPRSPLSLPRAGLAASLNSIFQCYSCTGHSDCRKTRCPIDLHVLYSISSRFSRNYSY